MNSNKGYKISNPAKTKLILSGLLDLIIALFFAMLIAFTLFYLICPIFNIPSEYTQNCDNSYDILVARYFGGMSGLVAVLFLVIAFAFLIGLIFSFSYIKSSFVIARMDLASAKPKTKILTLHGIIQLLIGIISFALAIYTIIIFPNFDSAKIVASLDALTAVAFLTTGSIKLSSAQSIRNTKIAIRNSYQQDYLNYYYHNQYTRN